MTIWLVGQQREEACSESPARGLCAGETPVRMAGGKGGESDQPTNIRSIGGGRMAGQRNGAEDRANGLPGSSPPGPAKEARMDAGMVPDRTDSVRARELDARFEAMRSILEAREMRALGASDEAFLRAIVGLAVQALGWC